MRVCLRVCLCTVCVWNPRRPEEGTGCPGTWITDVWEQPRRGWELNKGPLQHPPRLSIVPQPCSSLSVVGSRWLHCGWRAHLPWDFLSFPSCPCLLSICEIFKAFTEWQMYEFSSYITKCTQTQPVSLMGRYSYSIPLYLPFALSALYSAVALCQLS